MNRDGEHLACRFDAYCKRLLKHEVIDAIRQQKRLGQWETTFSELTRAEQGQLQYIDQYAPDRRVFPLLGMEIEVRDLVIDPEDAETVKLIFQKYVHEGYGALRLCRYFKEQGIRRKDGGEITVGMVNRAVRNSIYIGVIHRGDSKSEVLPDLQIIDEELFLRAQEIASTRKVQQREVPLTTRGHSLLVGNVYCGCCGARLMLTTSGHRYRRKDGTEATSIISSYKCYNRTNVPGKCEGQSSFSVEKLDNLVDQIIRIQLTQIQKAPPQALLEKQRGREADLARAKVKRLQGEYQQKQRDYQDLRAETLKVIQGNSQFSADLLNSLMDETTAQLKELERQMQSAELELRETVSGAEQVKKEYTQLMNWAELYDNCTFEAKKMIVAQFVKAVHVKRGYELDIEFNVSFEEFQSLYLEPEEKGRKRKRAGEILALAECVG